MIAQVWRDLSQLVWSWWMRDRIRASPAEGRLLRIRSGDLLTVGGIDVEVLDRSITEGSTGPCVRLMCRVDARTAELHLTIVEGGSSLFVWIDSGDSHQIAADDVQAWPMPFSQ